MQASLDFFGFAEQRAITESLVDSGPENKRVGDQF
jgi:hypothetical protein